MNYRIWYSTESFADYIIENTNLQSKSFTKKKMYESDANNAKNFHTMPDHIKKILYLDAPDIIVEINSEPIFSIEFSTEAGTGHNAFQRFDRLAASVENNVPAFYVYPEATIVTRQDSSPNWDKINPLIFKAMDNIMSIYRIPALLYYFPSDHKTHERNAGKSSHLSNKGLRFETDIAFAGCPEGQDNEMGLMFSAMNEILETVKEHGVINAKEKLLGKRAIIDRKNFMQAEYHRKAGHEAMSPMSAVIKIPTEFLMNYLSTYENNSYQIGELIRSREETIV